MSFSITDECVGCGACVKLCPVGAVHGEKQQLHAIDAGLCIECAACGRICPAGAVLDDRGVAVAKLKKSRWPRPVIDPERCYACENCVVACPAGALAMADDRLTLTRNRAVLAQPNRCVSCGWCAANCLFGVLILEAAS